MSNEISLEHDPGFAAGVVYATILDPDTGLMARLDTQVWEAPAAANWDAYDIPLTESSGSGIYRGDFPTWIPAGTYQIGFRERLSATVDETDDRLTSILFGWTGSAPASGADGSARATLADLITRLRDLISDPAGPAQVWTDLKLQEALDKRREDVRYLELTGAETIRPGGAVVWLDYYAPMGDWETDGTLYYGGDWSEVTPDTSDWQVGHWTFAADRLPPVYLVGKTYDLYGAAADMCEKWAAKVKLDFTFSPGRGNYTRSQKHQMLLTQAEEYRRQARPRVIPQWRGDTC